MTAPMPPDRLAEIEACASPHLAAMLAEERPDSAVMHRIELLAEVKRLTEQVGKLQAALDAPRCRYQWGESVTWTYPEQVMVPLNRGGEYRADLVFGNADEVTVLIEMLADAINPDGRRPHDRRRTAWVDEGAMERDEQRRLAAADELTRMDEELAAINREQS